MKKLMIAALAAVGMVVSFTGPALAAPDAQLRAGGEPAVSPAQPFGYYIWVAGDRVQLRTTDPGGDGSVYSGSITVNGAIRDVTLVNTEDGDWAIRSGNRLDFRFRTFNQVDGVAFTATGAERVTFRLFRNGRLISEERIFLGAAGFNPPNNPFTLFF